MKIVGVTGNSGAGKTTFSNMLGEVSDNVGVIHVDDFLAEIKKKYFRMFLQPAQNNTTEATKKNPKLKSNVKNIFYKNKILFALLMKIRSTLVKGQLEQSIKNLKLQGKRVIAIDDWALTTHKDLYKQLNKVYFIEKPFLIRREHLRERDAATYGELRVVDTPYSLGFLRIPKDAKVVKIRNDGSLEELQERAKEEYIRLGELTFDERHVVSNNELTPINIITKSLEKTRELRERSRENN